ncbi:MULTISPECIES: hypothetical protein [Rhodococcus]|uniref:Uracil-DNA glycosylase-like domain-containing protein n=1 Tax=Rhodococcus ruber BKS 20-38 TaxID=1278076 RepID=M3A2A4_9NOCA|nr:hypothetical protein [Rhodococcus ruber]EME66619.1 hypothetical protein G352_04016 [Rhodococcus ruber BKS 20-38]NCL73875.1 hypothetical protein [Rhodococcus sp. YH1]
MSCLEIPSSPRALSDDTLRLARLEQAKKAPSVLELNRLIWRISNREESLDRLPYLDPTYGGVDADVILLLKAPQADADPRRGAGRLISLDNDDEVAATLFEMFRELGIERRRCVAWNICPFEIRKFNPDDAELAKGKKYFRSFTELIHCPQTVLVLGSKVGDGWKKHSFDDVVPGAHVVFGPSPSPPGINRPGARDELRAALVGAFG